VPSEPIAHSRVAEADLGGNLPYGQSGRDEFLERVAIHASIMPLRPDGKYERMFAQATAPQRLATLYDAAEVQDLMRDSILSLFPAFYDERQTASAAVHIGHLDLQLIEDGTYFVHEADGEIVACGGWSRRNKLYTGSGDAAEDLRLLDPSTDAARVRAMFVRGDWTRRGLGRAILESCQGAARAEGFSAMVLMATLPGEPLYRAFGFRETGRGMVRLPDGVELAGVEMERAVDPA
jgi:GNAT superfamily N-acetyltransferase